MLMVGKSACRDEAKFCALNIFYIVWQFRAQLFKTNDVVSLHVVKTLIIKYGIYANIFAEKMWVAFAFAKTTHIFFSKNTCEFDIVLTRTVNTLTTNELGKLTMLWTAGPWLLTKTFLLPIAPDKALFSMEKYWAQLFKTYYKRSC